MSSIGPRYPTTATGNTNTQFGGTIAWANPTNIEASDGAFATAALTATDQVADDLLATGFGFVIPTGATINGILAEINAKSSEANDTTFQGVWIYKNGTVNFSGTNESANGGAGVTISSPGATTYSFGSSVDTWAQTGMGPAFVNASDFGIAVNIVCNTGLFSGFSVGVDFVRVTIYYTALAPTISSITPNNGPTGTSITNLAGTNFFGGTGGFALPTVTFGGVAATNVVVVSSTQITCTVPAGTGTVNVVVTNPDGQAATLTNGYSYNVSANFNASGQSSATSVHAPALSGTANTSVTGVSSTTSVHAPFVTVGPTITGQSSTTSVGSTTQTGTASTSVTGLSSTTSVGPAFDTISEPAASNSSTTSVGSPTYTGTATFALTGLRTTSSEGIAAATGISQALLGYFQAG